MSGVWPVAQNGVTMLLVIAPIVVMVVHDLIPTDVLRPVKFAIEGAVSIGVATVLVLLTGRQASPFFFAFPLIVAGAALVVSDRATLVLTALAILGYVLAVTLGPGTDLGAPTVSTRWSSTSPRWSCWPTWPWSSRGCSGARATRPSGCPPWTP